MTHNIFLGPLRLISNKKLQTISSQPSENQEMLTNLTTVISRNVQCAEENHTGRCLVLQQGRNLTFVVRKDTLQKKCRSKFSNNNTGNSRFDKRV